ncbi:MAG TPA: hypothetical protein VGO11_22355 [Chthoniobacteraceae bacterium]|nr:hypothetical protein [Chthoniobacteraceae bacterium]
MNFLRTAFNSNLATVSVPESARAALESKGITQPTLQKYIVWRRATILMVVIGTLLAAGVSTFDTATDEDDEGVIDTIKANIFTMLQEKVPAAAPLLRTVLGQDEKEDEKKEEKKEDEKEKCTKEDADAGAKKEDADDQKKESSKNADEDQSDDVKLMGKIVDYVHLASLYVLPFTALVALLLGNRLTASYRVLLAGFLFSFFVPILVELCPWSWWGIHEPTLSPGENPLAFAKEKAEGLFEAVGAIAGLLPAVLSLVPGVVKGCLRVKTLLPQSMLPGWLIVMAAPLYGLFLLAIFVALDQFTSQPFILAGFGLVTASSLVYAFRPSAFTRPLITPEDFSRMKNVQRVVGLLTAAGGLLLLGYLLTREFLGVHLLGTDQKTALMRPIDVVEFLFETIARGMFVTALSADLFLRANLNSWKHQRALAASPAAAEYDAAMEAMDGTLAPKEA